MPVLDRQRISAERTPDRIPETQAHAAPEALHQLSAIALVAGALAITAIEDGTPMASPIVKLCALVAPDLRADHRRRGAPLLSERLGVDADRRGRGMFRLRGCSRRCSGSARVIGAASLIITA
jgi:hypothetical protein